MLYSGLIQCHLYILTRKIKERKLPYFLEYNPGLIYTPGLEYKPAVVVYILIESDKSALSALSARHH